MTARALLRLIRDIRPTRPNHLLTIGVVYLRRIVVFEHRADLLLVGIAALAAGAYLPFTGRLGA